ncbi:MAG: hypothetical protein HYU74_01915 [Dechloromonas sp.]|nr:hypothetical protein [Dechloromonas sp.]
MHRAFGAYGHDPRVAARPAGATNCHQADRAAAVAATADALRENAVGVISPVLGRHCVAGRDVAIVVDRDQSAFTARGGAAAKACEHGEFAAAATAAAAPAVAITAERPEQPPARPARTAETADALRIEAVGKDSRGPDLAIAAQGDLAAVRGRAAETFRPDAVRLVALCRDIQSDC